MYTGSSYMLEKGPFWLIIHLNEKCELTSVEDHDHYSGGHISPKPNETQEQLFTRRAMSRGFVQKEIDDFLEKSKNRTRQLAAPKGK